jgi:hypothetical protein
MEEIIKFSGAAEEELAAIRIDFHHNFLVDPGQGLLEIPISIRILLQNEILLIVGQNYAGEIL